MNAERKRQKRVRRIHAIRNCERGFYLNVVGWEGATALVTYGRRPLWRLIGLITGV